MSRRVLAAIAGASVAAPLAAVQAVVLLRAGLLSAADWQVLLGANIVLMIGCGSIAADFVRAGRTGRAILVGVGVPMLLPGPTVLDSVVQALPGAGSWLALMGPNVVLLAVLGVAEAWVYLRATKARPVS